MSPEGNIAVVRRYFDEYINRHRYEVAEEIFTRTFVFLNPAAPVPAMDQEGLKKFMMGLTASFPDIHYGLEDVVADEYKVAAIWTFTGTNSGSFRGRPPTGRQVTVTGMNMFYLTEGKISQVRVEIDSVGMLQQLGIIPAPVS